jgi:hypothetical protein
VSEGPQADKTNSNIAKRLICKDFVIQASQFIVLLSYKYALANLNSDRFFKIDSGGLRHGRVNTHARYNQSSTQYS